MTRPGTFERVYAAIKEQLRCGLFRPGDRLEPAILSGELNASVTPVRDALHRLTGERLVEAPRHEGFRVPQMTEATLRHLYAWHHDLLLLAIAHHHREDAFVGSSEAQSFANDHRARLNAAFVELARRAGNPELLLAFQSLLERVAPLQRIEALLLGALEEETDQILSALRTGERASLRTALTRYHRRRVRIVPELLEQLHRE